LKHRLRSSIGRLAAAFGFVAILAVALGYGGVAQAAATTYYVDAVNGDDSQSGASESAAWRSVSRVGAHDLGPGDRVLFRAGQTFVGTVELGAQDAGTPENPVVVGSFGGGRATINAGAGRGVSVYNAGGVEVRDLNVAGAGYEGGNRRSGIEFYTDLGGTRKLSHVRVANVEVSGFGDAGVLLGAYPSDGTKSGYRDVRITNVEAHGNADAGIETYGYFSRTAAGWAHEDVYVGYSRAYDNLGVPGKGSNSGNGIVLGDVNGAVVERNVAHGNGERNDHRGGGPVGIWAWDSNRVAIQHNESYGNGTGTIDGGGFDLDGGVTNSVVQYNYSHDNEGAGYLLYQFSGARPFGGNTVRYNISENDGRTNLGGIYAGGGAADTDVHNNTIYASPRAGAGETYAVGADGTRSLRFRNNIFFTTGGTPLAAVSGSNEGTLFQGNNYWSGGDAFAIRQGGATHTSLGAWRRATGQERNGTAATGLSVAPGLNAPGGGGTIGDAAKLTVLSAYRLRPGSPMIDAALDLRDFRVAPGPTEFYGARIAQGPAYDVGANEIAVSPAPLPPSQPPDAAPTISALRPAPGSSTRDRTPTVGAAVRDDRSNLARRNLRLYVDGRRVTTFAYDRATDRLRYTSDRLSLGRHTAKVVAVDPAGLREARSWRFRVVR